MKNRIIKIKKLSLGNDLPLTLIAGPCQIESKVKEISIEISKIVSSVNQLSIDEQKKEIEESYFT